VKELIWTICDCFAICGGYQIHKYHISSISGPGATIFETTKINITFSPSNSEKGLLLEWGFYDNDRGNTVRKKWIWNCGKENKKNEK
jgi:hypothetical protein